MKKILFMLLIFIFPFVVRADHIYSINMDIDIDKDGNAKVTEIWDVRADSGSEWYKTMYELGSSELTDFFVYMDNQILEKKVWNVDESMSQKAGYYGVNTTSDGIELCFGKKDYNRHIFKLEYKLSNYIFNTDDSQVLYWTLIPKITLDNFSVDVTSYYPFPDTLDVWGYGYKGYAYVKDGKISMSNETYLYNQNVVLLAKFPMNTFNTNYKMYEFNTFNDVLNKAEVGSYKYNYNYKKFSYNLFMIMMTQWLFILLPYGLMIVFIIKNFMNKTSNKYGYINNKKINKKDVLMFRDIPCNKNIFYANILIKLNEFGYKKFNIFGAIILKWVNEGRINFINKEVGIFRRETSVIDLRFDSKFDNFIETQLFKMMYEASNDGVLEVKEFEKWVSENYVYFFELFNCIEEESINSLKADFHIYNRITKKECKYKNVMDDKIYNDSVQLYGLKKFLEEFSRMDEKEIKEVKLWNEYLMFAYLFGIADKVYKQLKELNPEFLQNINVDYDIIKFVDDISTKSVRTATSSKERDLARERARNAAMSYSSGGGGFSSGGGGGGSRGGGSRGSAGGR